MIGVGQCGMCEKAERAEAIVRRDDDGSALLRKSLPVADAKLDEAPMKAPVCSQTSTGSRMDGGAAGVQMFTMRQFSFPPGVPVFALIDGQLVGSAVAMSGFGAQGAAG